MTQRSLVPSEAAKASDGLNAYGDLGKVDGLKWVEVQDEAVLHFFDAFDIYAALAIEAKHGPWVSWESHLPLQKRMKKLKNKNLDFPE